MFSFCCLLRSARVGGTGGGGSTSTEDCNIDVKLPRVHMVTRTAAIASHFLNHIFAKKTWIELLTVILFLLVLLVRKLDSDCFTEAGQAHEKLKVQ
jgi:hypothetical protein